MIFAWFAAVFKKNRTSFARKISRVTTINTSYYNLFNLKWNMRANVYFLLKLNVVADNKIMLPVGKT